MDHIKTIATVACFSALFLFVVVPLGAVIRLVADPLKLRKSAGQTSYFNLG